MDAFIHHLQLHNTSALFQEFLINENSLPIPAIVLLCVAGRGFILWCLNIIFIHVVRNKGRTILMRSQRSGSPLATSSFGYERNSQPGNNILEVGIIYIFHGFYDGRSHQYK